MARIKLNQARFKSMQKNANAAVQQAIRDVNAEHSGEPVDKVHVEFVAALQTSIPAFRPDEEDLREYAKAISTRPLTDG